jgi:hypothetical protein
MMAEGLILLRKKQKLHLRNVDAALGSAHNKNANVIVVSVFSEIP